MKSVVLVGRPNAGKSSVYNALTGGAARVGNYPGVTVSALQAEVVSPDGERVTVVDLPGVYTLRAEAESETDEAIARQYLATQAESADSVLVMVIDATQLEHGLRLFRELPVSEAPVMVLLTQADLLIKDGLGLDVAELEAALGVPVCLATSHELQGLASVWPMLAAARVPAVVTWEARVLAARVSVRSKQAEPARSGTAQLDKWLLHPVVGPVAFALVMGGLFAGVFAVADPATSLIDAAVAGLRTRLVGALGPGVFADFLTEGVFGGAGTLLGFVPQIALLSAGMAVLDASGYLARASLLAHGLLTRFGLSGRAFAPLLMGHACAIPAIAATRTLRDPKERLRALMVLPLTTCSARIPTYALVIQTFFGTRGVFFRAAVFLALYTFGMMLSLLASRVLASRGNKRRGTMPMAIEMPRYRTPRASVIAASTWRASVGFVRGVGGMVLVASCALWGLLHVRAPQWAGGSLPGSHGSLAAALGRMFEPLTQLCGFDWRINVGLVGSFGARELMVSTLGVVFGAADAEGSDLPGRIALAVNADGAQSYSSATGLALLVFFVIACQCSSTLAALKRETSSWRVPLLVLAWTYGVAFALAIVIFQVARLFA